MNNSEKLIFIDGNFSHDEARSILMNIFSTKIQFHELRNFSAIERSGREDEMAKKRIPELKQIIQKVENILVDDQYINKRVLIKSEVHITFSDE